MARKLQGFTPNSEREYVPAAFGNRQDPDPVRVWIRQPTERDKREVEGDCSVIRFAIDDAGSPLRDSDGNLLMQVDNEEAMRRHHRALERFVVRVENYDCPSGGISTGKDLAEHGETAIVTEVYGEIMTSLTPSVDESKKSKGSPGSCSAATQASDGIAKSVSGQMTTGPATVQEEKADSPT